MSKQLDRLFREKLTDHQVRPTEDAWSKIEASLDKEKKGIVWFRAAAAIVLLGLVTATVIWVRSNEETTVAIAKVDSVRGNSKPSVTPVPKKAQKITEPKLPVVKSSARKTKVYIAKEEKKETREPLQSTSQEQVVAVVQEVPQQKIEVEQPKVAPAKRSIVLTYTLAEIPKQRESDVAAEEKNRLQKMVDIAMEAKHTEGGLAELRVMKDDLFALNFKKK